MLFVMASERSILSLDASAGLAFTSLAHASGGTEMPSLKGLEETLREVPLDTNGAASLLMVFPLTRP